MGADPISLPSTTYAPSILLTVGVVYSIISVIYGDSVEWGSEAISNLSAFVGITSLVSSCMYFRGYDVLAIIAQHDLSGERVSLPVFEGLAEIVPWWLLATMIVSGLAALSGDKTEPIGRFMAGSGGAYLILKIYVSFC